MKFLDIDEILAEEERLSCVFSLDASGLGYLDPTSNEEDLPENSKVELPLWLAVSSHTVWKLKYVCLYMQVT